MESTLTDKKCCLVCGSPYVEYHHVFFGTANRKKSDKYGYVIPLCREHHTGRISVHSNRQMDLRFKKEAQKHFEKTHTREEFIEEFGRSYL